MERAYKEFIALAVTVAFFLFLAGIYIGLRMGSNGRISQTSATEAIKEYESQITDLRKDNYRLVMLDSSLETESKKDHSTMEAMQSRENALKNELRQSNDIMTKFKYLYEKLDRYDSFTGSDIRRYFADTTGAHP